jgi:hypothetical protein
MAKGMVEYGFIVVNNRKAVAVRPGAHEQLSAVIARADIGHILADLNSAGWQLSPDNKFTGNETGDYELKIERPIDDAEPDDPRFKYTVLKAPEPFDEVRLSMERNGWDLIRVTRPINDVNLHLLFRGPKHIPDP